MEQGISFTSREALTPRKNRGPSTRAVPTARRMFGGAAARANSSPGLTVEDVSRDSMGAHERGEGAPSPKAISEVRRPLPFRGRNMEPSR